MVSGWFSQLSERDRRLLSKLQCYQPVDWMQSQIRSDTTRQRIFVGHNCQRHMAVEQRTACCLRTNPPLHSYIWTGSFGLSTPKKALQSKGFRRFMKTSAWHRRRQIWEFVDTSSSEMRKRPTIYAKSITWDFSQVIDSKEENWWWWAELNCRPMGYESFACRFCLVFNPKIVGLN